MLIIKVYEASLSPKVYKIEQFPCTIGRFPGNHIVLDADFISTFHGEITKEGNLYVLHDKESTNGIYVQGEKVQRVELKADNKVYFGTILVEILYPPEHHQDFTDDLTRVIDVRKILKLQKVNTPSSLLKSNLFLLLHTFIALFISTYLFQKVYSSGSFKDLILDAITLGGLFALLASFCALCSKLITKQFKWTLFFWGFTLLFTLVGILKVILDNLEYMMDTTFSFSQYIFFLYFVLALAFTLNLISKNKRPFHPIKTLFPQNKAAYQWSGSILSGVFLLLLIIGWASEQNRDQMKYTGKLIYPFKNYRTNKYPIQKLKNKMTKSFEEVDHLRNLKLNSENK